MTLEKDEKFSYLDKPPYLVAVSGGVDSVVLLDMLSKNFKPDELVVAHADHGIRDDSSADARFVEGLATFYGIKFFSTELHLGKNVSEANARSARYNWLNEVKNQTKSSAILTAHHQDDILETMIINLKRGTGWRGLVALVDRQEVKRPLLGLTKKQLYEHALQNNLEWVEDETNRSLDYTRNKIRLELAPKLRKNGAYQQLLKINEKLIKIAPEINQLLYDLDGYLADGGKIDRSRFIELDQMVRREWLLHKLRDSQAQLSEIGKADIVRMEHFICIAKAGSSFTPAKTITLMAAKNEITLDIVSI